MVVLGRVSGVFGVLGWVKVYSYTSPKDNIFKYQPWYLQQDGQWRQIKLIKGRRQGKGLVARLQGSDDREQAAALMDCAIAVAREQLESLPQGEYYWSDLVGLQVLTLDGTELGQVSHLFETGANDVLVVQGERERLIPYIWQQVIKSVDLDAGVMQVDWDPEF